MRHLSLPAGLVLLPLLLAGCRDGARSGSDEAVAARVNDRAISVSQVDQAIPRDEPMSADDIARTRSAVLESLIDEELMVQKANARRLDLEPRVSEELEAARRRILARAYLEQVTAVDPRPDDEAVGAFYRSHPALFAERRIYSFHEFNIQARPERLEALRALAVRERDSAAIAATLEREGLSFAARVAVLPAEQLPFERLNAFSRLKDGDNLLTPTPYGAELVHLASSRRQPLDEASARPVIEQFLRNRERVELARDEARRLRKSAEIEYVGPFSRAPRASAGPEPTALPAARRTAANQ